MDFEGMTEEERRKARQALFASWERRKFELGLTKTRALGTCRFSKVAHWNTPFPQSDPCQDWIPIALEKEEA